MERKGIEEEEKGRKNEKKGRERKRRNAEVKTSDESKFGMREEAKNVREAKWTHGEEGEKRKERRN